MAFLGGVAAKIAGLQRVKICKTLTQVDVRLEASRLSSRTVQTRETRGTLSTLAANMTPFVCLFVCQLLRHQLTPFTCSQLTKNSRVQFRFAAARQKTVAVLEIDA